MKLKSFKETGDVIKWSLVVILFVFGVAANYYYLYLPLAFQILGWLVGGVLILLIAWRTALGRVIEQFFRASYQEIKKVVWPTRQETMQVTMIVLAIVVAFGIIIWIIDSFLMWMIGFLTGQ